MQSKIKTVSLLFRVLFQICFIVIPVVHILSWIKAPNPLYFISQNTGVIFRALPEGMKIMAPLSLSTKIAGFLCDSIPVVVGEIIFYFLIKLFFLYEKGEIFLLQNVNYIKKIGYGLLALQILRPISEGLVTGVITWQNPPGFRRISMTFSGTDFVLLVTAFLIILVAWIMAEGCRLQEEQQLTV